MGESKLYRHLIFDLDHTLWDFTANSNETLSDLYSSHKFDQYEFSLQEFQTCYHQVNEKMWYDYHRNMITKEEIRNKRFTNTFAALGFSNDELAAAVNEEFLAICPAKGNLIPYAKEVLEYLRSRYTLHILTNGFKESQQIKISTSGIEEYFNEVISSETCGFLKPHRQIFEYTLCRINADKSECLMIGDDLHADILGARNSGIDQVFFNVRKEVHSENPTFEIECLSELKRIL
jgi:putative hydrolase of the HAD superfamily